ncbi:SDR family oxidoreductase [Paenibacillus sp. HB172176]|uniref:dTDP-4-dehydrorhamnose reductase family protein n=1 Tax=Paenibacillus sp. HB172176 TaxID=2493690 RepID=UPI00143B17B5|nr:SDR family oxidoreductase [Paenibacillus sp. HB172176]
MKLLILGGMGMAGHMIVDYFTRQGHEVFYTRRELSEDPGSYLLDVADVPGLEELLRKLKPEVVINAAGLLNDQAALRLQETVWVNSYLPQLLHSIADKFGFKLVHISTDCVFSGKDGNYRESAKCDGTTVYAHSKSLGEVNAPGHLTIRTSIIGPELKKDGIGLFHWFMRQEDAISGYSHVYWNGVTTLELAKAIEWSLAEKVVGLAHLTGDHKISKLELLTLIKNVFLRNEVTLFPDACMHSDKSLVNTRIDFLYTSPTYPNMLAELRDWMLESHRHYPYCLLSKEE